MGQVVSLSQLKPDQFGGPTQTGPTLVSGTDQRAQEGSQNANGVLGSRINHSQPNSFRINPGQPLVSCTWLTA